jgi:hypothetical protein
LTNVILLGCIRVKTFVACRWHHRGGWSPDEGCWGIWPSEAFFHGRPGSPTSNHLYHGWNHQRRAEPSGGCCVDVHLRARFPPIVWRPPRGRIQDRMARTQSAGDKATTAQATTPLPASEPANPSVSAVQPLAGTGSAANVPEVEHTTSGVFEVSLEGLRASAQDIEALRRIQALSTGKAVVAQQEQEARPSSSRAQPHQQQGATPTRATTDDVDFNIR